MKYSEALRKDPEGFKANTLTATKLITWEKGHKISNAYGRVQYKHIPTTVWIAVANAHYRSKLSPEEIATQLEACGE